MTAVISNTRFVLGAGLQLGNLIFGLAVNYRLNITVNVPEGYRLLIEPQLEADGVKFDASKSKIVLPRKGICAVVIYTDEKFKQILVQVPSGELSPAFMAAVKELDMDQFKANYDKLISLIKLDGDLAKLIIFVQQKTTIAKLQGVFVYLQDMFGSFNWGAITSELASLANANLDLLPEPDADEPVPAE